MKFSVGRAAWIFAFSTIALGAVATFDAGTVQSAQDESTAVSSSAEDSCLSDPVVLKEITQKKAELEQRQKDLQNKEAELKAREAALNDEFAKLQDLRKQISQTEETQSAAKQEKVSKVIETLQAMSPKASAQFLTTLDDNLAVAAIAQMDTVKLAKIMNTIDPKRGARLTELLAGVVRAHTTASNDVAETTSAPQVIESSPASSLKKGGNDNDSINNQSKSIISGGPDLSTKKH